MEIIDTENWPELKGLSTKGKRTKRWLVKDDIPPCPYLFKEPKEWAIPELWSEIFVYSLGAIVGIDVPETRPAINQSKYGVLVKYFLSIFSDPIIEENTSTYLAEEQLLHGGDLLANEDPSDYKGKHNLFLIKKVFNTNAIMEYWPEFKRILIFDCLIGNTDRHQDNWGVCVNKKTGKKRLAPAFDNSTCFAPELNEEKLASLLGNDRGLEAFLMKSKPPLYLSEDGKQCQSVTHLELIKYLAVKEPDTVDLIGGIISMPTDKISDIINGMVATNVPPPYKLSMNRASFILRSLLKRIEMLGSIINK